MKRADVEAVGAEGDQVGGDAVELDGEDADVFGPRRDLDAGEFFDGHRPGVVVVHGREVVEAVGVADVLVVGEVLADLLLAAVEVAEVGDGFEDHLAVGAEDDAEHAVGGRGAAGPC